MDRIITEYQKHSTVQTPMQNIDGYCHIKSNFYSYNSIQLNLFPPLTDASFILLFEAKADRSSCTSAEIK